MKTSISHAYFKYLLRFLRHYIKCDKAYRVSKFRKDFGFLPDLAHPKTFNEKILCRMIMPVKVDFITQLADKLKARDYVKRLNYDILPEIYGVFEHVDGIDISMFPEKFVLKCNHDTGSAIVCSDKRVFDFESAKAKLAFHLKVNMYYKTREWQYKRIKPVIICEEYIDRRCMEHDELTPDIFRFHCFDAEVLHVEVEYADRKQNGYTNIYDNEWVIQAVRLNGRPNTPSVMPKPEKFNDAILIAKSLSKGFDYCRIDLYITSTKIYFSEFTFSPGNGREKFSPDEWDLIYGKHWNLNR